MQKALLFVILCLSLLGLPIFHTGSAVSGLPHTIMGPLGSTDYPWTMFRANALRSGSTLASGPLSNHTMWSFQATALFYSSAAVSDGLVFITSHDGNVYAIDEYTGLQKWVFQSYQYVSSTPAVSNGLVYITTLCPTAGSGPFTCKTGNAYALDEQTGGVVWQRTISSPISSSPVVADGRMFYGSITPGNGQVYARYAATGNGNWTAYLSDAVESSPSVDNGRVFVGQLDGAVVALNENTGAQLWRAVPVGVDNIQTGLAVANGMVFVATTTSGVVALNENTGATVWTFAVGGFNSTSVAVSGGRVYFGTGGGTVYALNATTGKQVWSTSLGGSVSSSPALALGSGRLFVGANDARMYSLDVSTGTVLWRYLTSGNIASSPAVADGRAFFGSQDLKVYAIGANPPTLHVSISANPASVRSGMNSSLTITVTNGSSLQPGVNLAFNSPSGGSFTQSVMIGPGVYRSNFTAPSIGSRMNASIQVTASRTGYLSGIAQIVIALNPLPTLTVNVTSMSSSIPPGGNVLLMIKVTNATLPVAGAALTFSPSAGGSFSGVTDAGNGNYTVVFNAPIQGSGSDTITVQASKPGFTQGQGETVVSFSGFPDLTRLTVAGIPFLFILGGIVLASLLTVIVLLRRKKKSPPQYVPPAPSFNY